MPFAVLATVQVTLIASMTVIVVALPVIRREMDATTAEVALVNNAYPVAFCGLLLFGGKVGDVVGRRATFLLGTAVFGVASAAAGLAPGLTPLLLARFGQGCGAALAAPAALALVDTVFADAGRRARAVAIWGGLPVAGATTGLLLSGIVVETMSWRWAFTVPVAVAIVVLAVTPRLIPPDKPESRPRLDVAGGVLVTAGMSALCYGLVEAGEHGWASAIVLGCVVGGAVLLGGFALVQARVNDPLLPLSFFRSRRRVVGLGAVSLASAGTSTLAFFLPLYFQQVRGLSPAATSAAFVPFAIAMIGTGIVAGRLVPRFGDRVTTVVGLGAAAAGLLLISGLTVDTPYVGAMLAGLVLFPVGISLVFSGGTVAALHAVPRHHAGLAGGVLNTAMEGGPAVGFAILIAVSQTHADGLRDAGVPSDAAATDGYGLALTVTAVTYLIVAVIAANVLRERRFAPHHPRRHGGNR